MNSRINEMAEAFEFRRADEEAAAIAAERIRSGAADHKEDGAEALARVLGFHTKDLRKATRARSANLAPDVD